MESLPESEEAQRGKQARLSNPSYSRLQRQTERTQCASGRSSDPQSSRTSWSRQSVSTRFSERDPVRKDDTWLNPWSPHEHTHAGHLHALMCVHKSISHTFNSCFVNSFTTKRPAACWENMFNGRLDI